MAVLGLAATALVVERHGPARGDRPRVPAALPPLAGPSALVLDGVSGHVEITGSPTATAVTGSYLGAEGRPAGAVAVRDGAVLCDGLACAGDLRLTVPQGTALTLRQTSGETVLTALDGDLDVSVASVRFTATALRPAHASITVESGSADLGFAAAPERLGVRITSASVALRLPAEGPYEVSSSAVSADVRVALPSVAGAAHRLELWTSSASVAVLPLTG